MSCGGVDISGGPGGIATCPDYDQAGSPQPKSSDGTYEQTMTIEHGQDGSGPGASWEETGLLAPLTRQKKSR